MTSAKITLQGHIIVPKDRLEQIRKALPLHIALTRAETGCLIFNVTENTTQPGHFDVYEEFSNRTAFDAHQKRGAASDWAKITDGVPRHFQISEGA